MVARKVRSSITAPFKGGSCRQSQSLQPPVFIVGDCGLTVMFSHAGPLLLFPDGEIKPFPHETDEEQAGFVLSHIRVGRA
jgi:hypothetical protein